MTSLSKQRIGVGRLLVSVAVGLALAVVAALHALSMVATKGDPDAALKLFPLNGEARELVAFNRFTELASEPEELQSAAEAVREPALAAFRHDPSSAKALALLTLTLPAGDDRNDAALAATAVNRRDLSLQGLVLQAHLANQDYPRVVETLDQILRVHITRAREFFPLLGEALRDERTIPSFVELLDGSSPWHARFFTNYALTQDDLLRNLALMREQRELVDEEFDARLINRLARAGDMEMADRLYETLTDGQAGPTASDQALLWTSQYPPYDWRLADARDRRAQLGTDGQTLDLFVRSGRGGVMAERLIETPAGPFAIEVEQRAGEARQSERVRIELSCLMEAEPFFSQPLADGQNTLQVTVLPACERMMIAVHARAFSGGSNLRNELGPISITPR